jgi:hypothetical protein
MRPTISEQLAGASRLLEQFIAPEIADAHASALLANVIDDLRMLETSWADVLPFLHWDNAATGALLSTARATARPPLRATIDSLLTGTEEPVLLDFAAAHERNMQLRQAVVEFLAEEDDTASATGLRAASTAHLTERAGRYPMRMSLSLPTARPTEV